MNDLIIVNDVFDNPNEITRLAKQQHFYKLDEHPLDANTQITWSGKKSLNLDMMFSSVLYENIINHIISKLKFSVDIKQTVSLFHSFTEDNLSSPNWFHTDNTRFGGVVYLNNVYPKQPENHGTMVVIDNKPVVVPYEYNKMVLYPSHYVHRPMNGFGDSLDTSRLTLNFFIR